MNGSNVSVRVACISDAEELLEIYAPYVTDTAITFEYDIPSLNEFKSRIENTLKKYPYLVAMENGKAVGYAYASCFKARAAYDRSVETSIYVKAGHERSGIGSILYQYLEKALALQGILNLNACIASADANDEHLTQGSIVFHKKCGYRLVGKFEKCGYKFGKWYDMVWMEKHIGAHTDDPAPVLAFSDIRYEFDAFLFSAYATEKR